MTSNSETSVLIALKQQVAILTSAVQTLCIQQGSRLNRAQLAQRLGIHRNSLSVRLSQDRSMPRPAKDGKWLLSEIIEWETQNAQR